jgi:orotidine-5'-phosphate decarboxylase
MSKSIIVAIDETKIEKFKKIVDSLDSNICMIKIGSVSFNAIGSDVIFYAASKGFEIFLDLKLHDIPNTVKKSVSALIDLPIKMMTIHTSGGLKMMMAAMDAVKNANIKIFGVTALTSLTDADSSLIFKRNTSDQVKAMLDLAEEARIDGVVCSPHELHLVSRRKSLQAITPGIRIKKNVDDQARVMTPKEAIKNGADFIVIGRPITLAKNINAALHEIHNSI